MDTGADKGRVLKKTRGFRDKGKLRIGDDWNAITIIALSQNNPLKAIAEFVENSIDAGAERVTIVRGKEGGHQYLKIIDNGRGIPRTPEGVPDFKYVATHICDSLKRRLRANRSQKSIKIKIEVDINPPAHASTEIRYIDFPFLAPVAVYTEQSLFSGKLHALLCREYEKGRDWYDFFWYVSRKTKPNFKFLSAALMQQGPWKGQSVAVDGDWVVEQLKKNIEKRNMFTLQNDIRRFVKPEDAASVDLWSRELFLEFIEKSRRIWSVDA